MKYRILIVIPPGYAHSGAFFEVAEWLESALRRLSIDAVIGFEARPDRRHIVLGTNLLPNAGMILPEDSILYNLEQVYNGSPWFNDVMVSWLRRYEVWDYSARNAAAYAGLGLSVPKVVRIGFAPELERIKAVDQDIDVLFYGSASLRRSRILDELRHAGLRVLHLFGVYGAERDAFIARAKVVLNLHYYEVQVFEIVRIAYLLNNRCCIVCERGLDETGELEFKKGIAFAGYDELVPKCLELCADPGARARIGNDGYEIFRRRNLLGLLQAVGRDVERLLVRRAVKGVPGWEDKFR